MFSIRQYRSDDLEACRALRAALGVRCLNVRPVGRNPVVLQHDYPWRRQ